jgi:aspartyl-tRNA(Asn)/glutamyl-tRNA(Gln) amidotransferase subunit B
MVKIGLEIHGYLKSKEKLFCKCKADYKEEKIKLNTNICPICTAQPGCKPMLPNQEAIKKVIAIGLMLGCKINSSPESKLVWQRKHYDWPDLPKGYQNTISGAYSLPIAESGEYLGIKIRSVHIEEDPASWNPETGEIDYNRCGLPLVEITTEPDFKSSKQVRNWLAELLKILNYIEVLPKDAGIKADVNISITGGERVEVKNVNSLYSIERVIDIETARQEIELKSGKKIKMETRRFDEKMKRTISMRDKENAEDYRFIPEPDLPALLINSPLIDSIKQKLPESHHSKIEKYKLLGVEDDEAKILAQKREVAEFYERIVENENIDKKLAAHWVTIELLRVLNYNRAELKEAEIKPEHFSQLLTLLQEKKITEAIAKKLINEFYPKSFLPSEKLRKDKVERISDKTEIEKICKKVVDKNKKAVEDYKKGEEKALDFLLGQVMKESRGQVESRIAREILAKMLK